MPSLYSDDLKQTYAQVSSGYAQSHGNDVDSSLLDQFLNVVPVGSKILDLGAGLGRDAQYFATKGWDVTLFDLSPELLALAKAKNPNSKVIQGDMTELPFSSDTFGGIWASMSLLHLTKKEMDQVLQKIYSILIPRGVFMCKMRSGDGEKIVESKKYGKPMKRFFAFYTMEELVALIRKHKFNVLSSFELSQDTPEKTIVVMARKDI